MSGNPALSAPLSSLPAKPNLSDALNALSKDVFLNLFTHHIGTITSVDYTKQTATATINYTKTYYTINNNPGPAFGTYTPVQKSYPPMTGPLIILGGGRASLTFPITVGDECLCLFNDRDFSNWFNGNSNAPPASARLHSPSDALILVGVRSLANVLEDYDLTRAVLQNGSTFIGVSSSLIKIANATQNLNTLLQDLVSAIKAITTLNSDSTTGAVSASSQAALALVATHIGQLLE